MKNDRVWFITGASKGIGLQLARQLLQAGARVAVTSRSSAAVARELGDEVLALEVDLADEASVARAVAATIERYGRIDVVVNNAGYGQMGAVEEVSDAEARRNFDVNVFGVLNVLRATLPHLRAQRSGHVINIASIAGFVGGFTGWGVYCASKFALAGLTEGLHADLAELGVKVTLVYPGYFRTEFLSTGTVGLPEARIDDYAGARSSERAHRESIAGNQPGDPAKLASVLLGVAAQEQPPLHLFVGSDSLSMAEKKLEAVREEVARHAATSRSTDF